jgi:SanA protein
MSLNTHHATRIVGLLGLAVGFSILRVQTAELGAIASQKDIRNAPYAIVLGASVKEDGTASDALLDRLKTGVELYQAGKVSKILLTGDGGAFRSNETDTMKRVTLEAGVTSTDVLVDGEGFRTYESCKRAAQEFGIKQAIVVTQRFHLGRALYLCRRLGIDVQGVSADKQSYVRIVYFTIREMGASAKAWWDVNILAPESPVKN